MAKDLSHETHEALSRLIATQPFYAVLLMDLAKIVEIDKPAPDALFHTAATNGRDIFLCMPFWKSLNLDERVFVFAHETEHIIFETCQRMKLYMDRGFGPDLKPFNSTKFNKAADYVQNDMLVQGKVGKIPKGALHNVHIATANDLEDDVYCRLPDDDPNDPTGKGKGNKPGDGGGLDYHMAPADDKALPTKTDIQRSLKSAVEAQKTTGSVPGWMKRMVDDLCEPQIPWTEEIRTDLTTAIGRDEATWTRPNKRRMAIAPHVYTPGRHSFRAGVMVCANDTSGSVSEAETNHFYGEMAAIAEELKPEELWLTSCAMEMDELVLAESSDDVRNYVSNVGGGTDMTAIFRGLEEKELRPDCLVILTDGETDFGEPPGYPVIWVITNRKIVASHGKTIWIDIYK